ncbi:MAG: nucleotide exchange factor GrpE [Pedosphaera sp.]|nr:nucleotide exchange factor GrpE [Pedosphaera sp.]
MSREGKEENQKSNQIEITNSKEKDNPTQVDSELQDEVPGQTDEETETEEKKELPPPTPEELKQLREQATKAEEYYDRLQRQVAEADNLRKRLAKEKQEAIRYANESLIVELLPTIDNFEMAINAAQKSGDNSIDSLKTGIEMIYTQIKRTLEEIGVTEIDATGQTFDPSQHEAMSRIKTSKAEEGTVLEQTRKGYRLRDRLLRAASVVVAIAPDETQEETEQQP